MRASTVLLVQLGLVQVEQQVQQALLVLVPLVPQARLVLTAPLALQERRGPELQVPLVLRAQQVLTEQLVQLALVQPVLLVLAESMGLLVPRELPAFKALRERQVLQVQELREPLVLTVPPEQLAPLGLALQVQRAQQVQELQVPLVPLVPLVLVLTVPPEQLAPQVLRAQTVPPEQQVLVLPVPQERPGLTELQVQLEQQELVLLGQLAFLVLTVPPEQLGLRVLLVLQALTELRVPQA